MKDINSTGLIKMVGLILLSTSMVRLKLKKMRVKSVSQNKIVWQRYAIPSEDYDPSEDEWDGHDAFGYYDLWTWERYK